MPPDDYYVDEGSNAILQWTYCKPSDGLVTGIIVSRGGSLLSIDVAGEVTRYPPNNQHNNITSLTWTKKNGSATFIIRSISIKDSGRYILKIRMVGYPDLANKVNVVVRKAGFIPITIRIGFTSISLRQRLTYYYQIEPHDFLICF